MAHVIGFNGRACTLLQGAQKNLTFTATPSKAEVAAAMKQRTTRVIRFSTP
jgi:hypothetical protein